MITITTVAEMQVQRGRMDGTVGLVPTMGFLHEGHLGLVRRALAGCDNVVVSIFVNPTQFGPNEDFARYPRDEARDVALLEATLGTLHSALGTRHSALSTRHSALVFVPTPEEIYPPGFDDWVEVKGPLTERLEGAHRPGHFRGVTTVVARLFRIIRPHRAYFGQKDAQQLRVIRRMVREQKMSVQIVAMPTVREADGLAMSSRNVYLSSEERRAALALPRALALARRMVMDDGVSDAQAVRIELRDLIEARVETPHRRVSGPPPVRERSSLPVRPEEPGVGALRGGGVSKDRTEQPDPALALDYISVSDEQTLEELETIDRPALVLLAVRIGRTRLIDNTIVMPKGMSVPHGLSGLVQSDALLLP